MVLLPIVVNAIGHTGWQSVFMVVYRCYDQFSDFCGSVKEIYEVIDIFEYFWEMYKNLIGLVWPGKSLEWEFFEEYSPDGGRGIGVGTCWREQVPGTCPTGHVVLHYPHICMANWQAVSVAGFDLMMTCSVGGKWATRTHPVQYAPVSTGNPVIRYQRYCHAHTLIKCDVASCGAVDECASHAYGFSGSSCNNHYDQHGEPYPASIGNC